MYPHNCGVITLSAVPQIPALSTELRAAGSMLDIASFCSTKACINYELPAVTCQKKKVFLVYIIIIHSFQFQYLEIFHVWREIRFQSRTFLYSNTKEFQQPPCCLFFILDMWHVQTQDCEDSVGATSRLCRVVSTFFRNNSFWETVSGESLSFSLNAGIF